MYSSLLYGVLVSGLAEKCSVSHPSLKHLQSTALPWYEISGIEGTAFRQQEFCVYVYNMYAYTLYVIYICSRIILSGSTLLRQYPRKPKYLVCELAVLSLTYLLQV
jgi:hypothetical protein